MDSALYQLMFLRMRGGVRHRLRQLATIRGAVFLTIVAGIIWLLAAAGATSPGDYLDDTALRDPEALREHIANFMPLGLLAASLFTVFVSTGPAIYFSANEINFLFSGPFRRRDLVIYKFATYFVGAIVSAAIITVLIPPRASTMIAAFTGMLLTLLFIQLSSSAIRVFALAYGSGRFAQYRWPVIGVALAVTGAALFYAMAINGMNIVDVVSWFRQSWAGAIILAPFVVFAKVLLADAMAELAFWTSAAIAVNVALLAVTVVLDERTSERSLSENRRLNERWMRVKQGGSFWASDQTTGRSVRRAPSLGGLGPIAFRQAINAFRNSGRVIAVFAGIAALMGPLLAGAEMLTTASTTIGLLYFFIAFVLPRTLVCDFRGELGRMEHYKALPIAPWRICAGQLIMPVLLASAIQLVMIVSIVPFLDLASAIILGAMAIYVLPFNLLLYGLENLVFLLFPSKLVPVGRVDFDFLGRTLVDFVLKTFVIFTALGLARIAGLVAQKISDENWFSFGIASWLTLAVIGLMIIPALGFAFRRFKISETIE
ncbi:MAG: hypothetical protein HKN11_02315 [Rhizobiales bacterium]|nr:hypothetical protein [Hyphomicrobiales bacterium]